ncbi:hypothetical protein ACWIUD_09465 [Helicobacter sp. 23-1044]
MREILQIFGDSAIFGRDSANFAESVKLGDFIIFLEVGNECKAKLHTLHKQGKINLHWARLGFALNAIRTRR